MSQLEPGGDAQDPFVVELTGTVQDQELHLDAPLSVAGPVTVRVSLFPIREEPQPRGVLTDGQVIGQQSIEQLQFGDHLVEMRKLGGTQTLSINGRLMPYFVTRRGYTLRAAAYASPKQSLLEAAAAYLGEDVSSHTVLTQRFGDQVELDPNQIDGAASDPPVWCGRKNFVQLNVGERALLAEALNSLYADGIIESFADEHADNWYRIHYGPAFLPWHRHFLYRMEEELRRIDTRLRLPFWDWTRADSRNLELEPWKSFFGGRQNTGGKFDHWAYERAPGPEMNATLPTLTGIANDLQGNSYAGFRSIEGPHHGGPHMWIGETMSSPQSPRDPLFYLHHNNLDRLWAIWQQNHSNLPQYSLDHSDFDDPSYSSNVPLHTPMAGGATPASMLDHTSLGVIYYPDRDLEQAVLDRGFPPIDTGDNTKRLTVPPGISFGTVVVGDVRGRQVSIRNTGSLPVKVQVQSEADGPFTWNGFEQLIHPCHSRNIVVLFRPTATGASDAQMTIRSDARETEVGVALHGFGGRGPIP
jgi:hypothetical protein